MGIDENAYECLDISQMPNKMHFMSPSSAHEISTATVHSFICKNALCILIYTYIYIYIYITQS